MMSSQVEKSKSPAQAGLPGQTMLKGADNTGNSGFGQCQGGPWGRGTRGGKLAACTRGIRLACLREREQLFRGQYLVHVEQDHEPAVHLGHPL
jgi:hypothetical protein